jgi:hypothetical protein
MRDKRSRELEDEGDARFLEGWFCSAGEGEASRCAALIRCRRGRKVCLLETAEEASAKVRTCDTAGGGDSCDFGWRRR